MFGFFKAPSKPEASAGSSGDDDLFDEAFQRRLEVLSIVSRKAHNGRQRAERRSKKTGSGIEFADYRDYAPGDDFRYIDAKVYQRTGRLLVRLFEEEEDLAVYIIVDTSASMARGSGGTTKLRYAKELAAALSYVALAQLDRVSVLSFDESMDQRLAPTRGKNRIFKIFSFLRPLEAKKKTSLKQALRTFAAQNKRRGVAILISDLYDPAGTQDGINQLRFAKFEPFVLHLIDPEEASPKLHGDVRIVDCETGESRDLTVTPGLLSKYKKAHANYLKSLRDFCGDKGVPYAPMPIDVPFDEAILELLRQGRLLR